MNDTTGTATMVDPDEYVTETGTGNTYSQEPPSIEEIQQRTLTEPYTLHNARFFIRVSVNGGRFVTHKVPVQQENGVGEVTVTDVQTVLLDEWILGSAHAAAMLIFGVLRNINDRSQTTYSNLMDYVSVVVELNQDGLTETSIYSDRIVSISEIHSNILYTRDTLRGKLLNTNKNATIQTTLGTVFNVNQSLIGRVLTDATYRGA